MLIAALLSLSITAPTTALGLDDALTSRELASISEEQELLSRQLGRLQQTMQVLVLRLEAEGRPRAVVLLKEGLKLLSARPESAQSLTLEESMEDARERMQNGQVVQSLERQALVISGLTELLSVLMERGNLDNIEERLKDIRETKFELQALSDEESELRKETEELREDSTNPQQRDLQNKIDEALKKQRELLEQTESAGRQSGSLELEQIEQAVQKLRRDLAKDSAVVSAWKPSDAALLEEAREAIELARRAEARASRTDDAEQVLRENQSALEEGANSEALQSSMSVLEAEAERAQRHARASGDESIQQIADAMQAALEAIQAAQNGTGSMAEATETAQKQVESMQAQSESQRNTASEAREAAAEQLKDLAQSDSLGGLVARDTTEQLNAAESAKAIDASEDAANATEEAAQKLRDGIEDLKRMSEAMAGSQDAMAQAAKRQEHNVETLEASDSDEGQKAREGLNEAAEAMRAAASEARKENPVQAQQAMDRADKALRKAEQALDQARQQAGAKSASERAEAQKQLAASMEAMQAQASEGSMNSEAQAETEQALGEAQQAMEQAAKELQANRGSAAAEEQRKASQALSKAKNSAENGIQPESAEEKQRAEELAKKQEEIRERILQLATREEEKRNPKANEKIQSAAESAEQASEQLESGQLPDAEQSEEDVERELEQALKELEKEEEQYEKLRQEELLFRITEEVGTALEGHTAQMTATREIDALISDRDRPSRSQKIRLRKIAREEEAIAERLGELAQALDGEDSVVFSELLKQEQTNLSEIADSLGSLGDWDTSQRTQSRQRDAQESLEWLLEALNNEQQRRAEEEKKDEEKPEEEGEQPEGNSENRLVPDAAELKLLRRMELDIQESVERLLILYPELAEEAPEDINPLILDDINRLALKHERTSQLFTMFRSRLGLPDPNAQPTNDSTPEDE